MMEEDYEDPMDAGTMRVQWILGLLGSNGCWDYKGPMDGGRGL